MRLFTALFGLLIVLGAGVTPGAQGAVGTEPDLAAARQFIDDFFSREMKEHGIPGAAFALVQGGKIVYLRGFGHADLEQQVPVDPSRSIFRVGSVSKTVTALVALELVQAGRLSLHSDLRDVLPQGAAIEIRGQTESVTIFHLLTHTAGFGERLFGQHARQPGDLMSLRSYLSQRLPPLRRPPGLVISYNDHNTALAGLLAEVSEGREFADVAKEVVFRPLGMSSSSFTQRSLPQEMERRLAVAYRQAGGHNVPLERDYVSTSPAAGLFATAEDLGRLLSALLSEGSVEETQAISAVSAEAMLSTQFRHGEGMRGRTFGFAEGRESGLRTLHKDGQCSGFTARLFLIPEKRIGWVSMVNLSIFGRAGARLGVSGIHRRLGTELAEHLYEADQGEGDHKQLPPSAATESLSDLFGTYRDTTDPKEGWEGVLIANEVRVTAGEEGRIGVFGGSWVGAGEGSFLYEENPRVTLRFVEDSGRRWLTFHGGSWEQLAWHQTARARGLAAVALWLCLASSLVLSALLRRQGRELPSAAPWLRRAAICLTSFPMLLLAAMFFTDLQLLYSGVTPLMRLVFVLPWAALFSTLVACTLAIRNRAGDIDRYQFVFWSFVGLICCGTLVVLRGWRLLGWPA